MPLHAYLAGALLLIGVGVLPHRVRQNAHFGLFLDCMPLRMRNRYNCWIGRVTLPHFVTQNVFFPVCCSVSISSVYCGRIPPPTLQFCLLLGVPPSTDLLQILCQMVSLCLAYETKLLIFSYMLNCLLPKRFVNYSFLNLQGRRHRLDSSFPQSSLLYLFICHFLLLEYRLCPAYLGEIFCSICREPLALYICLTIAPAGASNSLNTSFIDWGFEVAIYCFVSLFSWR